MKNYVDKDKLQEFTTKLTNKYKSVFATKAEIGSPLVASTVAEMTDESRVYVYTGSESGYTAGNWYYYDGSAWASGGVYNSTAFETDTTLAIPGAAADAKAVGDALANVEIEVDATLTQAGKAADAKATGDAIGEVEGDIIDLKNEILDITGIQEFTEWNIDKWYDTSGTTITTPTSNNTHYDCIEIACEAGDIFTLTGKAGYTAHRIYTWCQADGTVISRASNNADYTAEKIVAPAGAKKLFCNCNSNYPYSLYKGEMLTEAFIKRKNIKNADGVIDFNDLTKLGRYVLSGSEASSALNSPSAYAGTLLSYVSDQFGLQIYVNGYETVYYRIKSTSSWHDWLRPLKPDTTLSISGATADAKATGDAITAINGVITAVGHTTDNLFDISTIDSSLVDTTENKITGTSAQLNGLVLLDEDAQGGGTFNFEFDVQNGSGGTAGMSIVGLDANNEPVQLNDSTNTQIKLTYYPSYAHKSFSTKFPSTTRKIAFGVNGSPSSSMIFDFKNIKITKMPKATVRRMPDYYPNYSAADHVARNEIRFAGLVHDGSIFRMADAPSPIPAGQSGTPDYADSTEYPYGNPCGYSEFITNTWDTLLPSNYNEGDAYNENTTKIINVQVTRETKWTSTPYGDNQDTYPIYRYTFTPQTGYEKTIFLTAGCHGNEAEAYWGLYRLINMIYFEGYKYPTLRNLRDTRIIVIPVWNPWGMQHYRRFNAFEQNAYQAWEWLCDADHVITINGVAYDIADVGEANSIYQTLQEYDGALNLWIDFHTDPYCGRSTVSGEIDDPRGDTEANKFYGCYGFAAAGSKAYYRMCGVMQDFYNILKNEFSFTETWHAQSVSPNTTGSFTKWQGTLGFPCALVEVSTFMTNFPSSEVNAQWKSGSANIMKLAQEYYGNIIAELLR